MFNITRAFITLLVSPVSLNCRDQYRNDMLEILFLLSYHHFRVTAGYCGEIVEDNARILMLADSMREYILMPLPAFYIRSKNDEATKVM